MQPYPRPPDLVWPGHLHGTGCPSARAMDTGFPTVAWRLCFLSGLWFGSGFGCAPPLLAGVLGCVCDCVCAPLVPCHYWLGCALWLCVVGFRIQLRPATPGWGVGVCVCLCARSACTPPLLAGMCGVGVCASARVLAAPRHSWLGCWVVCVLVCVLRLYPSPPGWGVRRRCVCLGSGFGCAPPLLAGVLACVCVCRRALLVPRHSWLQYAVGVCVFGLGFWLHPATPGWAVGVWLCWCGRSACTPPLLAGVRAVGVCVWARVSAAPRHSWLGCWAVCLLVWALRLHPATPGWDARRGCVCLGSGYGCTPPLLAGVLGCVCAGVGAPLAPRHSWLGCAVWVCVFWPGFRLRPATSGWGVGLCVCSCARSACSPPLLAGVRGVGVCVWAQVSAAPRHSWLGCWGVRVCVPAPPVCRHSWPGCAAWVCVLELGLRLRPATPGRGVGVCVFVCVPPLYPAAPGWGVPWGRVCLGSGFSCTQPLLAGMLGCVCACVLAPLPTRHSWLGCALWVCVFGLGFRLRPATPGWGVRCWCGRSACTLPLLAGVRAVGVCGWARVSAAPRHSWPGVLGCVCAGVGAPIAPRHSWLGCAPLVCAFGLGFRLQPPTPGVCWSGRSACTPPLLAGVRAVGVCVWARVSAAARHSWRVLVWALRLHRATPGLDARRGCVCLGPDFGCTPPLLAGVSGCVCAGVGAPPAPCHSWLGCALWVCVVGLGFRLRPATPGLGCWAVCVLVWAH